MGELPGLLGSLLVCQPCNPTSSLHTFLQHDALQYSSRGRDDTVESSSGVRSPISTSCWEADIHISLLLFCYNPCFLHFCLLAGTAVEDWLHQYPRPSCWTETSERHDGRTWQHGYGRRLGCELQCDCPADFVWLWGRRGCVNGRWCRWLLQCTLTSSKVVGSHLRDREQPWAASLMCTSCLDEAESFFIGSVTCSVKLDRPPFCISLWK